VKKENTESLCLALLLLAVFLTTTVAGQTKNGAKPRLENELTVKPSPTPTPEPTLIADPLLIAPDPARKPPPERPPDLAYYIYMRGVGRVFISDDHGNTDDLFQFQLLPKVRSVTYEHSVNDTLDIIVPVNQTYSITFQSKDPLMQLEIVKGRGNSSPEEAIRYCDLELGRKRARFKITPQGIEPLRQDTNYNGRFDSVIEPTVLLRGRAARDTRAPEIRFRVVKRTATTVLIAIDTKDNDTGVKSLLYTFDGQHLFTYQSPVRMDLRQASFMYAFAFDYAGNRSAAEYRPDAAKK